MANEADIFATPTDVSSIDECVFYHTIDLPGIGTVQGRWDLRPTVEAYLGNYNFNHKKVLEIGPASGFLTFHMEEAGAHEITAVDLPLEAGYTWDYVPYAQLDFQKIAERRTTALMKIKNSFWFSHKLRSSRAKVYYGSAYDLPQQLGRFHVAIFGSVLLHTQNPLSLLQECSKFVDETMIVTEVFHKNLTGQPICRLKPTPEKPLFDTWWEFSPDFFSRFLSILGFVEQKITYSKQKSNVNDKVIDMFTIVASRSTQAHELTP